MSIGKTHLDAVFLHHCRQTYTHAQLAVGIINASSDIGASLSQLAIHQCLEYVLRILLVVHNPRRIPDGVALGHHVGTNRIQLYTLCHQRVDINMTVQT